jgi:hypothetical protein
MRWNLGRKSLFTAIALACVDCSWAQTKLLTLDLTPYGVMTQAELRVQYPIPNPPAGEAGYTTSGPLGGIAWSGVGDVVIDSQERLYVGLPIWTSGAAPKNALRGQGDKLRMLVLTTADITAAPHTVDFPTQSLDRLDLRIASDNTFVVLANDQLMRVSTDGKTIAKIDIPNQQQGLDAWFVSQSNTGRTLRLRENDKFLMLVDSRTLAVIKRCQSSNGLTDEGSMTDDFELQSQLEGNTLKRDLVRQAFCAKGEVVAGFTDISFVPTIVDGTHFLAVEDAAIALRTLSGQTLWSAKAPLDRTLEKGEGQPLVSRDASRVAVRVFKTIKVQLPDSMSLEDQAKGTWNKTKNVQVEDTVAIWDLAAGQLVAQVPLPGGEYYEPNAQFALSPNGHLLTVLKHGTLTVWRLP